MLSWLLGRSEMIVCSSAREGERTFGWPVIIRDVNTTDVMVATVDNTPFNFMCHLVDRITQGMLGVNRVLYDFTPKPTRMIMFEKLE